MTDAIHLGSSAYMVGRSDGRWALYWFGCRNKRHGIGFRETEVSKHVSWLPAARRGGEGRGDCRVRCCL